VTLQPKNQSPHISCTLETVTLEDGLQYEALSYAWGNVSIREFVMIEDVRLTVTTSLKSALRHLRHDTETRKLWIDAICINQDDTDERSKQVCIMKDIYTSASSVIIWLGEENAEIALGFNILQRASPLPHGTWGNLNDQDFHALVEVFSRSWWTRAWIVQELSYAREAVVYAGHRSIPWTVLESGVAKMLIHVLERLAPSEVGGEAKREGIVFSHVSTIIRERISSQRSQEGFYSKLGEVLYNFRYTKSTDPKDKVFAFLGLRSLPEQTIVPDYTNSVAHIYTEATKVVLSEAKDGGLNFICHTTLSSKTPAFDLPSWVIDWSRWESFDSLVRAPSSAHDQPYHADEGLAWQGPIFEGKVLKVHGLLWDQISRIVEVIPDQHFDSDEWWKTVLTWEPENLGFSYYQYPNGEDPVNAYWRTLLKDCSFQHERLTTEEIQLYRDQFLLWSGRPTLSYSLQYILDKFLGNPATKRPFWKHLNTRNWRFCITGMGYFGMVPLTSQLGDAICIIGGSCTPWILRTIGSDAMAFSYQFVGAAYVHGIMDGEAMTFGRRETCFRIE
jgi:hypothetical protein